MSQQYRPHVVKQGDYLTKLAFVHGFDAFEAWSHEKNREIKAARQSMDMLAPGDIVHLPLTPKEGLPFTAGTVNKYRGKVPTVEVSLVFANVDGEPMSDEPLVVQGGRTANGSDRTDATGKVTLVVPVTTREVTIAFTRRNESHIVRIGDLDPATEDSGVRQRLAHLGLLSEEVTADPDARLAEAIRLFQVQKRLPETGTLDAETRRALTEEHGV